MGQAGLRRGEIETWAEEPGPQRPPTHVPILESNGWTPSGYCGRGGHAQQMSGRRCPSLAQRSSSQPTQHRAPRSRAQVRSQRFQELRQSQPSAATKLRGCAPTPRSKVLPDSENGAGNTVQATLTPHCRHRFADLAARPTAGAERAAFLNRYSAAWRVSDSSRSSSGVSSRFQIWRS